MDSERELIVKEDIILEDIYIYISRLLSENKRVIKFKFINFDNEIDLNLWKNVTDRVEYLPVVYSWDDLKYQYSYIKCFNLKTTNLTLVIYYNDELVCGWPLTLIRNDKYELTTNTKNIMAPIFIKNTSNKIINKVNSFCCEILNEFCKIFNIENISLDHQFFPYKINENWYRRFMEYGARAYVRNDVYINLSLDVNVIHEKFRKSYRSLINFGKKNYSLRILTNINKEEFDILKNMHIKIAGRQTRSDETWDLQRESIKNSNSFVAIIYQNNKIIGWGLFELTKDECYFGVGVFERKLFYEPISHYLQSEIIDYLKENNNVKWYYIGNRAYIGDYKQPTGKELNISYFKEGFATDFGLNITTIISTKDMEK